MSLRSRAVLAVMAVGVAMFSYAATASAAPYARQPTLSIDTQTPAVGATVTLTGQGYVPGVLVDITLHSAVVSLGSATPNASGAFTLSATLPSGVSGTHTIVGAGNASNDTASVTIIIGGSGTGSAGSGSGGNLSSTGVAVIGIGTLGVVLLVGGGLMLLIGKRRKVSV